MLEQLSAILFRIISLLAPPNYSLQAVFYLLLMPLWLMLAVLALASGQGPLRRYGRIADAFPLLLMLTVTLSRFPHVAPMEWNPDEGLYLGTAARLMEDPVLYRWSDGETSGPLNIYPILLGPALGIPLDYPWLRLLGALVMAGTLALLARAGSCWLPEWQARLTVLPAAYAAATWHFFDQICYSSESMPNLLLAWLAVVAGLFWTRPVSRTGCFFTGVLLAAMPFSKLAVLPLESLLALVLAAALWRDGDRARKFLAILAGGLTWLTLLAVTFVASGGWTEFWMSYIVRNLSWANRFPKPLPELLGWGLKHSFAGADQGVYYWGLAAFACVAALLGLKSGRREWTLAGLGFVLFWAGVYTAGRPGSGLWHHLLMMFVPGVLSALGFAALLTRWRIVAIAAPLLWMTAMWPGRLSSGDHAILHRRILQSDERNVRLVGALRRYLEADDRVAIWGWNPSLERMLGRRPVTRFATSAMQGLETGRLGDYFLEAWAADLKRERPALVVDTTGPCRGVMREDQFALLRMGAIVPVLEAGYQMAERTECGIVFLRKDLTGRRGKP